jgi:hypothetical protein
MDLKAIRWKGMDWIALVEDRHKWPAVLKTVMNCRVPKNTEIS